MQTQTMMLPEHVYLIRKKIISVNQLVSQSKGWEEDRLRVNLNRFILPIAELLAFSFTQNEILLVMRIHPEKIIRNLPKFVEDQKYFLTAGLLPDYLSGNLGLIHNSTHNCSELDSSWVIRKKISNFLHSFTIFYNRKNKRQDRLFARKTHIEELTTDEEIRQSIVKVEIEPVIQGDKRDPEDCGNSLRETLRGELNRIFIPSLQNLFGNDLRELLEKIASELKDFKLIPSRGSPIITEA
jgi:hypothetical protein